MCRIFAGQDPAGYSYIARSVRLAGHATSIRLETAFWDILDEIAEGQGMTTPRFLSTLYDEVLELNGEISNFTSLLRVACVLYLQRPDLQRPDLQRPAALPQIAEPTMEPAAAE